MLGTWTELRRELDRWSGCGLRADFWLRDDDATAHTPELDRLLAVAGDTPLALSIIPGRVEPSLAARLEETTSVSVWQHGWLHRNQTDEGCSEYPGDRPVDQVEMELATGQQILRRLFGDLAQPIFVPPWSGFDRKFFPVLHGLGFDTFSGFAPRAERAVDGVRIRNTHVDLLDWTSTPSFADPDYYLSEIINHLAGRRTGRLDATEPTGILTHHLAQDDKSYAFLSKLIDVVNAHESACWRMGRDEPAIAQGRSRPSGERAFTWKALLAGKRYAVAGELSA